MLACNPSEKQTENIPTKDSLLVTQQDQKFDDRLSLVGDFNGDKIKDTIFESYLTSLTNKETAKELNSEDQEKNIELIINNRPVTKFYTHIKGVEDLIVTKEFQQAGISNMENLGDLNGDNADEFGYTINWADYSNINTYFIVSLKGNKFVELLKFQINEAVNFEEENLIEKKYQVKLISPKTIEYKFFSDTATVETGKFTFE